MNVKELQTTRQTAFIGCQIEHYPQVASTNDIAIARGKTGAAEGTLIIAEPPDRWTWQIRQKLGGTVGEVSSRLCCSETSTPA